MTLLIVIGIIVILGVAVTPVVMSLTAKAKMQMLNNRISNIR